MKNNLKLERIDAKHFLVVGLAGQPVGTLSHQQIAEAAEGSSSVMAANASGPKERLERMIRLRMAETGETHANAELATVRTPEGLKAWEQVRAVQLSEG